MNNPEVLNRPVVVLGSKGMLGQTVCRYFREQGFSVNEIQERFTPENKDEFIKSILAFPNAIVFNCIGRIKQKTDDAYELILSNTILPLELVHTLPPVYTIIHPSTDCIFDGNPNPPFDVNASCPANNSYAWSKRLGEIALFARKNTLLVRVSIIGLDNTPNPKGLLGWFLKHPDGSVFNGYTNHLWNGITTLEWCKFVYRFLMENDLQNSECKLFQLGTKEYYSKYQLLKLFAEKFSRNVTINEFEALPTIDRRLVPMVFCKPLPEQIDDLICLIDESL